MSCIPNDSPEADCGIGLYCHPVSQQCVVGCTGDVDCQGLTCDVGQHACVGCIDDAQCAPGTICIGDTCQPGCDVDHACQPGLSCCVSACFDLDADPQNCGACNVPCDPYPNSLPPLCEQGQCKSAGCLPGFADCDLENFNGCEHNVVVDGPCACLPGVTESCYLGAPPTEGVGPCHAGQRSCNAQGTAWGPCVGQVLPGQEICNNGVDDDCDGSMDEDPDVDLDGWTACLGDCNDLDPSVNPGAFEDTWGANPNGPGFVEGIGNGKDDDCDPTTPDVGLTATCSAAAIQTGVTPDDLVKAMDLCQTATLGGPKSEQTWGVLSASFLRPDGTAPSVAELASFQDVQTAVRTAFGASTPRRGATMAGFSTGKMRAPGEAGYAAPSPGTDLGQASSPPAEFLAGHGGALPGSSGCNGACPGGAGARDGVRLRLSIRVPSNAHALSFRERLFTAEYPGNVCSAKNDFFLALLTSGAPGLPLDKNVAFDVQGNLLSVNNLFFEACAPSGCSLCPLGAADLAGTGMPAATGWLAADMPVVPAETITLDLTVFDVSDGAGDSVVLIDGFYWTRQFVIGDW